MERDVDGHRPSKLADHRSGYGAGMSNRLILEMCTRRHRWEGTIGLSMKVFHCDHCGQLLFFENVNCVRCGRALAYVPEREVAKAGGRRV